MLTNDQLEEAVLALLCYSEEQAAMLALRLSDANIFLNKINITIAKAALEYINKYQAPPKQQLEYILEGAKKGSEGELISKVLALLQKKAPQYEPEFVIEELDKFLEGQKLQNAFTRALELAEQGDLEAAKEAAYSEISLKQTGTTGIWLNNPAQALSFLNETEEHEFFSSGVEALDIRGIRPSRKAFFLMLAAAKKGKSWLLVNIGKAGIQHHHKVLHLTLEMSEERTARRYIQSIFGLSKSEAVQLNIPRFLRDANSGSVSVDFRELTRPGVPERRREIAAQLMSMRKNFLIKEFPTSALSLKHLGLYLDGLERHEHFRPDLLIIDYADLMMITGDDLRVQTGQLYKGLRGLVVSRDMALASASQGNRESEITKLVSNQHVAEDWSKIGTVDNVVTYNQTPEERKMHLARLFVSAARDDEDRFIALVSQAYPIGQFAIDSVIMNSDLSNQIQAMGGNTN